MKKTSLTVPQRRSVRPLAALLLMVGAATAGAFSLRGPVAPWQTPRINYPPAFGPMNINEEYRLNVPVLYYGYTAEFYSYFGAQGSEAIDEAVAILNDIPPIDGIAIDDYPLESGRYNLRAEALNLWDIKSVALTSMLNMRGLDDSTRYVFTVRNHWEAPPGIHNYHVIKRNFDPISLRPSNYINGELWTYNGIIPVFINRFRVDPLKRYFSKRDPVSSLSAIRPGYFWTQLTRDDIGGLKHIYRSTNYNPEYSIPGVTGGLQPPSTDPDLQNPGQTGGSFPGGGGPFDFPGLPGNGSDVFDYPFNTTPTTAPTNNIPAAAAAIRGGIQQVRMERTDWDSLLGVYYEPIEMSYSETVLTNNGRIGQTLTRTILQPDVIFDARDLQGPDDQPVWIDISEGTGEWLSSDPLDGIEGDDWGPGVIVPPLRLVFNTAGPGSYNIGGFFDSEHTSLQFTRWARFDGSTREPVIFPVGTSILEIEERLRR